MGNNKFAGRKARTAIAMSVSAAVVMGGVATPAFGQSYSYSGGYSYSESSSSSSSYTYSETSTRPADDTMRWNLGMLLAPPTMSIAGWCLDWAVWNSNATLTYGAPQPLTQIQTGGPNGYKVYDLKTFMDGAYNDAIVNVARLMKEYSEKAIANNDYQAAQVVKKLQMTMDTLTATGINQVMMMQAITKRINQTGAGLDFNYVPWPNEFEQWTGLTINTGYTQALETADYAFFVSSRVQVPSAGDQWVQIIVPKGGYAYGGANWEASQRLMTWDQPGLNKVTTTTETSSSSTSSSSSWTSSSVVTTEPKPVTSTETKTSTATATTTATATATETVTYVERPTTSTSVVTTTLTPAPAPTPTTVVQPTPSININQSTEQNVVVNYNDDRDITINNNYVTNNDNDTTIIQQPTVTGATAGTTITYLPWAMINGVAVDWITVDATTGKLTVNGQGVAPGLYNVTITYYVNGVAHTQVVQVRVNDTTNYASYDVSYLTPGTGTVTSTQGALVTVEKPTVTPAYTNGQITYTLDVNELDQRINASDVFIAQDGKIFWNAPAGTPAGTYRIPVTVTFYDGQGKVVATKTIYAVVTLTAGVEQQTPQQQVVTEITYQESHGFAGDKVTVNAPQFKDASGKTITVTNATFTSTDTNATNFQANGSFTYTIPADAQEGSVIPVVVSVTIDNQTTQTWALVRVDAKDKQNRLVQPKDVEGAGYAGELVTTNGVVFVDQKTGATVPMPADVTFSSVNSELKFEVVNGQTVVKYQIPENAQPAELPFQVIATYKDGSQDEFKATITVKAPNATDWAADYTPEYGKGQGYPKQTVKLGLPTFTLNGQRVAVPQDTTFTVFTNQGITVNNLTGELQYQIPADATAGQVIQVPVTVTYKDQTSEIVMAEVTVLDATTDAQDNTPNYVDVTVNAGDTASIPMPSFDLTETTQVETYLALGGTKFSVSRNQPNLGRVDANRISIDENTGALTVLVPADQPVGSPSVIVYVDVEYPDGSFDYNVPARINVINAGQIETGAQVPTSTSTPAPVDNGSTGSKISDQCIASIIGVTVPLLVLAPLGLLSMVKLPGLTGGDAISAAIKQWNNNLQRQYGLFNEDLARSWEGVMNGGGQWWSQNGGTIIGGLGAIAYAATAALTIADNCVDGGLTGEGSLSSNGQAPTYDMWDNGSSKPAPTTTPAANN